MMRKEKPRPSMQAGSGAQEKGGQGNNSQRPGWMQAITRPRGFPPLERIHSSWRPNFRLSSITSLTACPAGRYPEHAYIQQSVSHRQRAVFYLCIPATSLACGSVPIWEKLRVAVRPRPLLLMVGQLLPFSFGEKTMPKINNSTTTTTTGSGPQTKPQAYTEEFSSLQWFRIASGTVHPEFELGDLVAVSPSQPVLDGDLALVGLNNSLLFARLYRLGDDRLLLSSGSSFQFASIDEVAVLSRVMARHRFYLRDGENPQYTVNAQPFGEEVR